MLNNRNLLSDNFKDEVKNKVLSGLVYLRDYESWLWAEPLSLAYICSPLCLCVYVRERQR